MLCARGIHNNQAQRDLVRLIRPERALLLSRHLSRKIGVFDRQRIDHILQNNPLYSGEERLTACHVFDSIQHVPLCKRYVPWTEARYSQVVTGLTLPIEHDRVLEAGFFSALNTVKRPMTHVLSKVINIRCQARKFSTVTVKLIRADREMSSQLRHLLLCSLLGNFPHCSSTLSGVARSAVYSAFLADNARADALFEKLIQNCSLFVINALRDFLIYVIEDESALRQRLLHLMHLERFTTIVNEHMDRVRLYFDRMLRIRTSALTICLNSDNEFASRTVYFDLNKLMSGSHASILKISYRRPNLDIHQFLMGMRKRYPLVPVAAVHDTEHTEHAEHTEDEEEDDADVDPDEASEVLDDPSRYASPNQFKALQDVLVRIDPLQTGALTRVTEFLAYFGVPPAVVEHIQTHIQHYHYSSISTEQLKLKFGSLQQQHPHAYNLLQIASELIKQFNKHHITLDLPAHLMLNQMQAARERVGLRTNPRLILRSALQFVYCDVCRMVYSLLRDWKSVYKTSYKLGLRDAVVSYIDDSVYCKRTKVNRRGECQAQPLRQINILGKVLMFQGKLIMLCPQQACCAPMVVDSTLCEFTERGIACKDCTEKMQAAPGPLKQLEKRFPCVDWADESKPHRQCAVCNKKMEKHDDFHLYPLDTVLCSTHSTIRMQRHIERLMQSQPVKTVEKMKQCMLEFCGRKRAFCDKHARHFAVQPQVKRIKVCC